MKVVEYLEKSSTTTFSYEIIPPLRGSTAQKIFSLVDVLMPFDPPFIDVTIPDDLENQVKNSDPKDVKRIGVEWALNQCQELLEMKVPCIHFYIMQSAKSVLKVVSEFK